MLIIRIDANRNSLKTYNSKHLNKNTETITEIVMNVMKLIIKIWSKLNNLIIGSLISMLVPKRRGDRIKA